MAHTTKTDRFTQQCRDFIQMLSYEDILACTVYAPPLLFMAGPATIIAHHPLITCLLNAALGCALSWLLHRTGHRLLSALPNQAQPLPLSRSVSVPVKLTRTQFIRMLEFIVAAAVFTGIVGKRWLSADEPSMLPVGLALCAAALVLYFLPVYLGRLWIDRYHPTMPLLSPTDEAVNASVPGLRSLFQ